VSTASFLESLVTTTADITDRRRCASSAPWMLRAVSNAELERWVTEMTELCTPDEVE
jgi:hypothetical protein